MHLDMVISGILDIRGHTQVEGYSEYEYDMLTWIKIGVDSNFGPNCLSIIFFKPPERHHQQL